MAPCMTGPGGLAVLLAAALFGAAAGPAAAADAPAFSASCATGITVKSNGKGKIRINGAKAIVTAYTDNAWAAKGSDVTITVSRDEAGLLVTYASAGANGRCQLTAGGAGAAAKASGVPKADRKACRNAVAAKAGNARIDVLEGYAEAAGNAVILSTQPDGMKWRCLVSTGKVSSVAPLASQGVP